MAVKKSQIYSSLWQSCDALRGGMDASQYKDYVLTLLFMKYVSDKYSSDPGALIDVPEGGGFADMVKLKGDKEIGDKINKIIGRLAEANNLKGVIDLADFNDDSKLGSGRDMQDRLSRLVAIFDDLDLSANRAGDDDLLGDAYEYLMTNFATESGKSKGQFYTPAEVSRVMAKVVGIGQDTSQDKTVYDPTCGSGSLLLRAAEEAPRGISIYGQEMDNATWSLAQMNMFLHGQATAEVKRGNTLAAPRFIDERNTLKKFDFAVANPPFSHKEWSSGLNPANDEYGRFEYGVPPPRNGDYAFFLHLIASLNSRGKGAIIMPHGVLFRVNREAEIRRNLIRRGLIKGIIGLPPNLFYGTGIPACILVIDKENASARSGIFMIDASRGFTKYGPKNRLREQDIHKIVDTFNKQTELPNYSRMVPVKEIESPNNEYNLNIPRYIDSDDPDDLHDLCAHLKGGIPDSDVDALDTYWAVFPELRSTLFQSNGRTGYSEVRVQSSQVQRTILSHNEFRSYQAFVGTVFEALRDTHEPLLWGIDESAQPKAIIQEISENLLTRFKEVPLLDSYDVYQRLLDYWEEVMQDDVYLIVANGWTRAAKPRNIINDKEKNIKETSDLTVDSRKYKLDLLPPQLVITRFFADQQTEIESLRLSQESAARRLDEYIEEHSGEEDSLAGAANDKGKVSAASIKRYLKSLPNTEELEIDEERRVLMHCLSLIEAKSSAGKALKSAQEELDRKVLERYTTLSESEIKTIVINDKWFGSLRATVERELEVAVQRLIRRISELEGRYARPLPELEKGLEELGKKVASHLARMGFSWA